MDLFTLTATLELDLRNFNENVEKVANTAQSLANAIDSKVITKGVAWGNTLSNIAMRTGDLLTDLGASMINAAAEVNAENAQFEAAFGDMADAANSAFESVGKDTNILATRLKSVGTKAFSQLKGAGLDANDALAETERYMRLAADAAAYYDISLEDADTRLRSFLRGNTEAGDAIGLFTSETQRNTYATEKYGAAWKDLTEAQKQMLMLDVAEDIYKQGGAIGQAAREGDSWSNVMGNLSETWRQILATVGTPLIEQIIPHIQAFGDWLNANQDKVQAFADIVGELAGATFDGLINALEWIATNGEGLLNTITGFFNFFRGGDNSPVSEGQIFGDQATRKAVKAWTDTLVTNDDAARIAAWQKAEAALGGQEAASTFVAAYDEYLKNHDLEYGAEVPAEWFSGTEEKLQSDLDKMNLMATVTVHPILGGFASSAISAATSAVSSVIKKLPGFEKGLDYVPHDDYIARLHEGEAVLTKLEANEWRKGGSANVDAGSIGSAVSAAVSDALRGFAVYMDGQKVGNLVTETVSRNIAQSAQAGRYA